MNQAEVKTSWPAVLILSGAGIISAFQVGKVPPLLPDIMTELDISLVYAGWILSIFNIIGVILGAFTGSFADTLGHRRLLISGLILQSAGSLLGSVAPSFAWLLVTRFFEGLGFLAVIVSTPTLIFLAVNHRDTRTALAIWTCYLPAGACLIMLIIPALINFAGWREIWQINGILIIGYTLMVIKVTTTLAPFRTKNQPRVMTMFKDIAKTASTAGPLLLALIFTTYTLQWLAVMGFLPTLLLEKFAFSKALASVLTAIMVGVNIIGNLAAGWLLNRGARRWLLITFSCTMMGICAIAIYDTQAGMAVNYTACILFSIFGGLIPATVLGAAPAYAPEPGLISTTMGIIIQGGHFGQVFGPIVLAALVSTTGSWETGSWFLAGVAALGIIFSLVLARLRA